MSATETRWRAAPLSPRALYRLRLAFFAVVVAAFVGLFFYFDGLRFPMKWDETHYWEASLLFSRQWIPSLDQLRHYGELNTPLPFIIYGTLEHATGNGLFLGRLLNVALCFAMVTIISLAAGRQRGLAPLLSACGLVAFPYFIYYGTLLYTDHMAAFFVLLGVWAHLRGRYGWGALAFALAISTRQYMLAFPLALAAFELAHGRAPGRKVERWVAPLAAAGSFLFWILIFGGLAPPEQSEAVQPWIPDVQQSAWALSPQTALYFLACVGLYFVVPETVLFRRWAGLRPVRRHLRLGALVAAGLLIGFVLFPPLVTHGLLRKAIGALPHVALGQVLLYGLALITCLRFARCRLALWILLANCAIMLKAFPWDKYVMPVVVVFWYLAATGGLDRGRKRDAPPEDSARAAAPEKPMREPSRSLQS